MSVRPTLRQQLLRRKPLHTFATESDGGGGLRRTVGPFQLTMIGIGATIGTGIFFLLGSAVPEAGPAVIVSFAVAAAAAALTALCYALVRGAKESAVVNTVMVLVKLAVLALFVVVGVTGFDSGNLQPFAPMGIAGIGTAAATVFFAFIGLDAVSTAGEEVREPRRTLPPAIVGALVVVTTMYILVAVVGVGAQPWPAFEGQRAGLSVILRDVTGAGWPAVLLSAGAVLSIVSVTLVVLYGQSRILYTMGRDGMLPPAFRRVSPRSGTPVFSTVLTGGFVAVLAAVFPLDLLADLTSMGTLAAFAVVSLGVMILRRTAPELDRGFRVPGYPVVPVLSLLACGYLIYELPLDTYLLFGGWLALALAVYLLYSRRNSQLQADPDAAPEQISA